MIFFATQATVSFHVFSHFSYFFRLPLPHYFHSYTAFVCIFNNSFISLITTPLHYYCFSISAGFRLIDNTFLFSAVFFFSSIDTAYFSWCKYCHCHCHNDVFTLRQAYCRFLRRFSLPFLRHCHKIVTVSSSSPVIFGFNSQPRFRFLSLSLIDTPLSQLNIFITDFIVAFILFSFRGFHGFRLLLIAFFERHFSHYFILISL